MANKRVGVIGGGQLAWMLSEASQKLGIDLVIQTPSSEDPAVSIAAHVILAAIDDEVATAELAKHCDVITFENEFINLEALKLLEEQGVCFRPNIAALSPLLDKYRQRVYLQSIGLPVPQFTLLETSHDLNKLGFPVVLKARRHGYDGQGTFIINTPEELEATWKRYGCSSMMLEEFVPFERELAVIAARSVRGEIVVYPVVETYQKEQVCRWVIVPANVPKVIGLKVESIARDLLEQLQVVGVFGIELFLTPEGQLLINEIAPRTHNSGHYTLDACEISQFEMQLRAVAGLPLGSADLNCQGAVMVNLLGYEHSNDDYRGKRAQLAAIPHAQVHWYGKTESRPGRKLGHVTVSLKNEAELAQSSQQIGLETAKKIESLWYQENYSV